MPLGVGLAPGGSSSAGFGVPDIAAVPINAPLPSRANGLPQTGRLINPVTKDFMFTGDGRVMGMGTVPQLVYLAVVTVKGSCVVPELGQEFAQIQEKGPSFPAQATAKVNSALAALVKAKKVQVVEVFAQDLSNPDGGALRFKWRDLTTGVVQTSAIGP